MSEVAPRSNDMDIRLALVKHLLAAGIDRRDIRHEITLDSSSSDGRADLVVLRDDKLIGAEIKSGKDTLGRLAEQRPRYSARFDRIVLFCDARHKPWPYDSTYGSDWHGWEDCTVNFTAGGAITFEQSSWCGLGALIEPSSRWHQSSHILAPQAMLKMLWANEIIDICKARGASYSTRSRGIPYLADNFPLKELRGAVIQKLRERQLNRWEDTFWRKFDEAAS